MDNAQAVLLALIQGLTEFLPVSSSAHLILPSQLLGWPDQGLAFDVAVHAGTLAAVVFYYRQVLSSLVGLAQALALIPGTSRSGITITASLFLGYNVATAARFSFLLSIPVIFGALILMLIRQTDAFVSASNLGLMALAMVISAISAYLTIAFFVGLVMRVGMMPFVVYRVALALGLFSIVVFL